MEIAITGEGEVVIRYIDKSGRTLLQERITISGSSKVEARRIVDLTLHTVEGRAAVAPVLMRQSNPKQRVTFDQMSPARFARARCREIGCEPQVTRNAAKGEAPPPVHDRGATGGARTAKSADRLFTSILRGAARR